MKTTRFISFVIALAVIAGTLFCTVSADGEFSSFYAPDDVQEELYEMIMKHGNENFSNYFNIYHLSAVKGSIFPSYAFDLETFAETGELIFNKTMLRETDETCAYCVKLITKDGEDAGCVTFTVRDGQAVAISSLHYFSKAYADQVKMGLETNSRFWASLSYADQAERISRELGYPGIIPPEYVKLTGIQGYGPVFYINTGDIVAFVPVGTTQGGSKGSGSMKTYYTAEELRPYVQKYVNEYKEYRKVVDAYLAEHPDMKVYPYLGSGPKGISMAESDCVTLRNVTDIKGFFRNDTSPSASMISASLPEDGKAVDNTWIYAVITAAVCAAVAAAAVLFTRKKAK